MKKLIIILSAACAMAFTSASRAEELKLTRKHVDDGWTRVVMNCDQRGRCWKEARHNALLDSYNYAPPPRSPVTSVQVSGKRGAP